MTTWRRAALAGLLVAVAAAAVARSDFYRTSDFLCLWGGARIVLSAGDPYDRATWERTVGRPSVEVDGQVVRICPDRYRYPLWTALLLAPLGLLPFELAAFAWAVLNLFAAAGGVFWTWRAAGGGTRGLPLYGALVAGSQPFWLLLANGQLGAILFGLAALQIRLARRGRDGTSGATLSLLAAKPQIVALYVPAVLARAAAARSWRLVGGAVTLGLALLVATVALVPAWPLEWSADVAGGRAGVRQPLATAWDLAGSLFGSPVWGIPLVVGLGALMIVLTRGRRMTDIEFAAVALSLSVFAAPYAWSYDFLILALPWGVTLANAERAIAAGSAIRAALALVAGVLPWSLYVLAFQRGDESLSALVPAATGLLVAISIRVTADQPEGLAVRCRPA